jgi:hypothetical protein
LIHQSRLLEVPHLAETECLSTQSTTKYFIKHNVSRAFLKGFSKNSSGQFQEHDSKNRLPNNNLMKPPSFK